MRNKELWATLLSFIVLSFIAGMVAGLVLSFLQYLYTYMDYAVGDLLREDKSSWSDLANPYSWRDYGVGIILSIDKKKQIAKIYWFEVGVASIYKFRNMDLQLELISTGK